VPSEAPDPPFVGRDLELANLVRLLEQHATVNVHGPSGIGKSALVLHALRRFNRLARSPLWVSMASIRDEHALVERTRSALGLRRPAVASKSLRRKLSETLLGARRTIVWDDVEESTLAPATSAVSGLDPATAGWRLIVISQSPIAALPGFEVGPLEVADASALVTQLENQVGTTLPDLLFRASGGNPLLLRLAIMGLLASAARPSLDLLRDSLRNLWDVPSRLRPQFAGLDSSDWTASHALEQIVRDSAAIDSAGSVASLGPLVLEHHRSGDVEAALQTIREIEVTGGRLDGRLSLVKARLTARSSELKAARRALQPVSAAPSDPALALGLVALELPCGDLIEARARLRSLAATTRSNEELECQRALALALSYFLEERFERALVCARRARRASSRKALGTSMAGAVELLALLGLDEIDRALALLEREVSALPADDAEEPLGPIAAQLFRAAVDGRRGDLAACLGRAEPALAELQRRGDKMVQVVLSRYAARAAIAIGRFERAEQLLRGALDLVRDGGLNNLFAMCGRDAALLSEAQGDRRLAQTQIAQAAVAQPRSPWIRIDAWALSDGDTLLPSLPRAGAVQAYSCLRSAERSLVLGQLDGTERCARSALEWYQRAGAHYEHTRALLALAELQLRTGALAEAARLLDDGARRAQRFGYALVGTADVLRAALADRTGSAAAYVAALAALLASPLSGRAIETASRRVCIAPSQTSNASVVLDAVVERVGLLRPCDRVVATDSLFYFQAREEPLPFSADLVIDLGARSIAAKGRTVVLTPQRIRLMEMLALSGGRGVSHEEIYLDALGGREYHTLRHRNNVYVATTRVRAALALLLGHNALTESDGRYRLRADICVAVVCDAALAHSSPRGSGGNLVSSRWKSLLT